MKIQDRINAINAITKLLTIGTNGIPVNKELYDSINKELAVLVGGLNNLTK